MVHQIINNRFRVFVESFFVAAAILLIGFSLGYFVESYRSDSIIADYKTAEVELLDLKLQNYFFQTLDNASCDFAFQQQLIFADKLYSEGLRIENLEEANQLTDTLRLEKRRYVLLKSELWLNVQLLKARCNLPIDTLVYFYSGDPHDTKLVAQQKIISNILKDLKEKKGNSLILLPLAGDLHLGAIDLQTYRYNVSMFPTILINERNRLEGYHSLLEIESYLTDYHNP